MHSAVLVSHLDDFEPKWSVQLDGQYTRKHGLFLEIRKRFVRNLQDLDRRPPLR